MVNEQLKKYIHEGLKSGKTRDEIKKSLLEIGWREADIQEAFASSEMPEAPISTQETKKVKITESQYKTSLIRFLSVISKRPRIYYVLGAILLIAGAIFLYQKVILKEEISEFELTPKIADTAGVAPNTIFVLKSTANLGATVVQKYLQFEPQVKYKIRKVSGGSSVFEITPAVALNENEIYSVKIAEGPIAARAYSWAYQVKAPFQVTASLPRDKSNDVPTNTGIEIIFNRENLVNPEQFFEISPAVSGRFENHRNILVFIPFQELNPKTVYTIKIKAGIKSQGSDDTLSKDAEIIFETGEKYTYQSRPYFNFDKTFWEFKPDTEAAFAVNYSSLPTNTVSLTAYRFDSMQEFMSAYKGALNEENKWTRYHAYNPVIPSSNKKIFESNVPLEEQTRVKFIRMPRKLSDGFYLADVVINNEHKQAWFQVTPIVSFSAVSGSKTLIWLKDLDNGNNISNAEVSFESNGVGKTNNDGVAMFNTPLRLIRNKDESNFYYYSPLSYFYTISAGGKQVAIPVENEYGYFSKLSPPDTWWDYFSIDKGVYLPTDKVHFWGIVRQRNGTDIKGEEVTIQLTNLFWAGTPKDDITVYGEIKSQISDFYTLTGEISFSDLKPGSYQLSVKRGDEVIVSENVNVETYIKPAYKLTLAADKNAVFAGDTISYKIKAEFFDGIPVANLRLKYNGYFYGEINGEVWLNHEGEGSFRVKTEYQEDQYKYSYGPRYLDINVSPAVSEEGEISSSIVVLVFGPRIDLRSEQSLSDKTIKFDLKLKKIVLDKVQSGEAWRNSDNYLGDPVPDWSITADVDEIIYKQTEIRKKYDIINKVTYPIYSYSTEYKPVRQDTLITDGLDNAHYEWTPEEKKSYRIAFTTRDAEGRLIKKEHYVYGGSFSYLGFYDIHRVTLKNLDNKNEYKSGEQVRLQMQDSVGNAMAPGSGKFVFLLINNGVISYQIADSPDYSDNFKDTYAPNIDIIGVWFSGSRFINSYSEELSFNSDERRLNIEVKKDKERYRPRDKVNLNIRVTDKNGSPKQAEVNISGIDEAVFSLNPTEKDITSELYQHIFSSLITRSSHVSPLEEGGGGGGGGGEERFDFRDVAIYKTIRTNSNGYAKISFDVPDNLTSWRLTTQAITKDLFAGKAVNFVPVGLPFFVETALNRTYLAGDNLNLRARVFGAANVRDNITYTIESETLPFKKIEKTGGKIIEIPLGNLTPGEHQIKISAKAGDYSDVIIRDLNVLSSYFSQDTSDFYELSSNLSNIRGATKGYTSLLITSYERGRFYDVLRWLDCECGARADQKFAEWFAGTYLNRFFGEKNEIKDMDARSYQTYDGGITLMPYSDKDLELSAKFANLIKDEQTTVDKESLKRYFTASLNDRKTDLSRIVVAFYGLSTFKEPILVSLQNIKSDQNLTLIDKIYIALALDNLGAKEESRNYYKAEIKPTLTTKKPFVYVGKLKSQDDNIIATALLAGLTASLAEPESDGLGRYATENYPKETLKNFEVLLYLKAALPKLSGDKVSFSWRTSTKSGSKTLENNEVFRLELSREELAALRFSDINGRIGLVSNFEKESSPAEVKKDSTIGVTRNYSVDGRSTTGFSDGDLVRIDIAPTFAPNAPDGAYQVIDYLPSGLRATNNLQRMPIEQGIHYHLYPSDIEDQKITFVIWKNFPEPFFYYARVVSKGDYKAEPAFIQSLKSLESSNISNGANIKIR